MTVKKWIAAGVLLTAFNLVSTANAQGILPGGKTIGEKLDDFGKAIFGDGSIDNDYSPNKEAAQQNKGAARPAPQKTAERDPAGESSASRSGSAFSSANTTAPPAGSRPGSRYPDNITAKDNGPMPKDAKPSPAAGGAVLVSPAKGNSAGASPTANQDGLTTRPMYERLSQTRRSVFDESSNSAASAPVQRPTAADASAGRMSVAQRPLPTPIREGTPIADATPSAQIATPPLKPSTPSNVVLYIARH